MLAPKRACADVVQLFGICGAEPLGRRAGSPFDHARLDAQVPSASLTSSWRPTCEDFSLGIIQSSCKAYCEEPHERPSPSRSVAWIMTTRPDGEPVRRPNLVDRQLTPTGPSVASGDTRHRATEMPSRRSCRQTLREP